MTTRVLINFASRRLANQASEEENTTPSEEAGKTLGMSLDNLVPNIVLGSVGLTVLLLVIVVLLLIIKHVYPRMPGIIKKIIMKIKSKLMWSTALRYTT